jgi:CBS domain-containing membrane protein
VLWIGSMGSLKVRDVMTGDVFALTANDTLDTLYDLMDAKKIRHMPIVNADHALVGLVTERDMLKGALGLTDDLPVNIQHDVLAQVKVGSIMTMEPETCDPEDELVAAAQIMLENKYGCLPVVDGDRLVGILTEADFVKLAIEQDV